ncbi:MAG: DUF4433 domain-containing protein [Phycisphaerae bacterium]|nr:DUF4433 domain-containing protein [Phycisphaerae bacterium]
MPRLAPRVPTNIFHITHFSNLASIIGGGELWCDALCTDARTTRGDAGPRSIAHEHIKRRRAQTVVPVSPRGTLADYVPFYFAPRSPMLFAISRGSVRGYDEGQEPIVHLVSNVASAMALRRPWCFTDGHLAVTILRFFTTIDELARLDWSVMNAEYWSDTPADPDKCRRRQAEFLVHQRFEWRSVTELGVQSAAMRRRIEDALRDSAHQALV